MTQEIILEEPYPNGSVELMPEGQQYVAYMHEIWELYMDGKPIYVKYLEGDRKGSIARFVPGDPSYGDRCFPEPQVHRSDVWAPGSGRRVYGYRYNNYAFGICHWDGRRNKVKESLSRNFAWLKGYDGPTVWMKFNAKEAKAELLKKPNQKDIDGNVLRVGDKVMYANIRYGGGTMLCHGTIARFEAKANSRRKSVNTIVVMDDGDEESCITKPHQLIWKKDKE